MTHNFANWEITQLLPEKNPYLPNLEGCLPNEVSEVKLLIPYWNTRGYLDFGYHQYSDKGEYPLYYQHESKLRDAWSWECIRLYLLSKGYIIDIVSYVDNYDEGKFQILYYWNATYTSTFEVSDDFTYYHTYEECREAAILFTLNELHDNL